MNEDRRQFKRVETSSPVRYQIKGSQRFASSVGRDISDGGIGFLSNEYFPVSSQLVFETLHPESHKFLRAAGEVVWISNQPHSERFFIGARFTEPPTSIF